ncbi:MAG: formate dehydrogenase accessory sulfurtransferase FdhD [Nitrososphaerales archaeon]
MGTPGNDFELSAGFLLSEGVARNREDIVRMSYCTDPEEIQRYNIVNVYLSENVLFDTQQLSRHVYTSSSCGVCGKASLEQVRTVCNRLPVGTVKVSSKIILSLPSKLKDAQNIFTKTGGLHAAALFDAASGSVIKLREDVGRHNALDKIVGSLLMAGSLPASETLLMLSGRASFELVQKAAVAGIPFICAVGAPSSLAVELACEYKMTLVGFLRENSFNIYSGGERIIFSADS